MTQKVSNTQMIGWGIVKDTKQWLDKHSQTRRTKCGVQNGTITVTKND